MEKLKEKICRFLHKEAPCKYVVTDSYCVFVMTVEEAQKRNMIFYKDCIVE